MAQRGGTVLSHLKVGGFSSPLIRPAQADGLVVLKAENLLQHGAFLRTGGWAVVNGRNGAIPEIPFKTEAIDADRCAQETGNPKSVNLIVLGYLLGKMEAASRNQHRLFCGFEDIRSIVGVRFSEKKKILDASLQALETGYQQAGAS
jgi:indolepyruvate ferredoxin oxidoreductase beta subunit